MIAHMSNYENLSVMISQFQKIKDDQPNKISWNIDK